MTETAWVAPYEQFHVHGKVQFVHAQVAGLLPHEEGRAQHLAKELQD